MEESTVCLPVDLVRKLWPKAEAKGQNLSAFVISCLWQVVGNTPELKVGDLVVDRVNRKVFRGELEIHLPPKAFDVLVCLMLRAGTTLRREQIHLTAWGKEYDGLTNCVDVYISMLRNHIQPKPFPRLIHTARGIGYSICAVERANGSAAGH